LKTEFSQKDEVTQFQEHCVMDSAVTYWVSMRLATDRMWPAAATHRLYYDFVVGGRHYYLSRAVRDFTETTVQWTSLFTMQWLTELQYAPAIRWLSPTAR